MPANNRFNVAVKNNASADAGGDVLDLYFLDTIQNPEYFDWNTMQVEEGNLVSDIISQVQYYKPSKIVCHIDSFGGNLPISIATYNFLKDYPAKVECKVIGFCASAATVIACAASKGKLTMPYSGFHITHEASMNNVSGTGDQIRKEAEIADKLTRQMADILASRNTKGHTAEEMIAMWKGGDVWMSGEEAEQYGFVDACYNAETANVTARIEEASKIFRNAPKITAEGAPEAEEEKSNSPIEFIKKEFMELKTLVTAALDKIKGNKVDSKSTSITADIAEALAQPLNDMVEEMQTQVTTEMANREAAITASVTEKVTADVEQKYKADIDDLKKKLSDIEADVLAASGRKTTGADTTEGKPGKRALQFEVR